MNQFFSFHRFRLLVLKHWADNKKRYGLSVLAFIGLLIVFFIFTMLNDTEEPMEEGVQQASFLFSLFVVGSFYASQYFRELGSRPKGINFLLVPASSFEKILCALLYNVVLFPIVFTLSFYLADVLMVTIANTLPGVRKTSVVNVLDLAFLRFNGKTTVNFLVLFISVQSAFLLGSIYFEKYSFIKTVISGFVGCFVIFCLVYFLYSKVMPEGDYLDVFLTSYRVEREGSDDLLVQLPGWIGHTLRFLVLYAMAPFFWLVTYYRLKEKQV